MASIASNSMKFNNVEATGGHQQHYGAESAVLRHTCGGKRNGQHKRHIGQPVERRPQRRPTPQEVKPYVSVGEQSHQQQYHACNKHFFAVFAYSIISQATKLMNKAVHATYQKHRMCTQKQISATVQRDTVRFNRAN